MREPGSPLALGVAEDFQCVNRIGSRSLRQSNLHLRHRRRHLCRGRRRASNNRINQKRLCSGPRIRTCQWKAAHLI